MIDTLLANMDRLQPPAFWDELGSSPASTSSSPCIGPRTSMTPERCAGCWQAIAEARAGCRSCSRCIRAPRRRCGDLATFLPNSTPGRTAALPRVQLPRQPCEGRHHRLRRHHRGDDGHGRALPDAARHHRAAGDGDDRHERADRHRSGALAPRSSGCSPVSGREAASRRSGTDEPASGSSRFSKRLPLAGDALGIAPGRRRTHDIIGNLLAHAAPPEAAPVHWPRRLQARPRLPLRWPPPAPASPQPIAGGRWVVPSAPAGRPGRGSACSASSASRRRWPTSAGTAPAQQALALQPALLRRS